jgi:alcohol-forming fatty acyl-CoA reductase
MFFVYLLSFMFNSLSRLQHRIIYGISVLYHFTTTDYTFNSSKLKQLFDELDEDDKRIFNFDHNTIDWNSSTHEYVKGIRKYLLKEEIETIPKAQEKLRNLFYADVALKCLFVLVIVFYFIYRWFKIW